MNKIPNSLFSVMFVHDDETKTLVLMGFDTYEEAREYAVSVMFERGYKDCRHCVIEDIFSNESERRVFKEHYHNSYLRSERWEDVRKAALARDHYKCRHCGSKEKLQGHHTSYKNVIIEPSNYEEVNGRFNEELADVITLCERCHKKRHGIVVPEPKYKNYDVLDDDGNVIERVKILDDKRKFI